MEAKNLEKVGLSPNEAKVYLALLDLGSSLAGKISEKTGIHRRSTYDALERLLEKGISSFVIKNGKKNYEATHPSKLLGILKEKEKDIKRKEKIIQEMLPNLVLKYKENKSKLEASIYRGKEGLKTVLELILKEKKDWISIGSSGKGPKTLPYFLFSWHKRRTKLKIRYKGLIAKTLEGIKRSEEFSKIALTETKFLPEDMKNPQTIWIFGNKVAIILVSIEQPILFLIENREIANSFRNQFNYLWKQAKN